MKKVLVAGVMFALVASGAFAADQEQQENKDVLVQDELVVTASRVETRAIDVPINTQVITREQIEMSGVTDVGDLLGKYVTGHYHKYNGILSPVGLRGFRTDGHGIDLQGAVLLLIDGHRVGTGNAAKLSLDRIERVEIIKGSASALYGSAAMGGVVNLITKKGDGKLGGSVGAEAGSFDYLYGQANVNGALNEKFRFMASVSGETIGDYDTVDYGTAYNTGVDKINVGGNLVYTINENNEIRFGGNYADLVGESPSWAEGNYSYYDESTEQYNDKSTGYADLEYNGAYLSDQVRYKATLYYLWDKNHWYTGSTKAESDQTKYIQQTFGTDQQLTWKIADWNTLLFGLTWDGMEQEGEGVADYQPTAPYTPDLDYTTQGYFIQDSLDLFDNRLNIIAAVRYDRFDIETMKTKSDSSEDFAAINTDFSHVSPKLGVGMKFFEERLRLRADLGEAFKAPSAGQLGYDTYFYTYHYLGNPDLDPETSFTYNFGLDVYLESISFKADYFHTDYEDRISTTYSSDGTYTIVSWENTDSAVISGLEFSVDWDFGETLGLPFSASLWSNMSFNLEREDESTGKDLTYISDYEIKSGLKIGYDGLLAQLTNTYVGPQMISTTEEKASFQFWDLTMRYTFLKHWEVKASILNLFDEDYSWVKNYPMPERNYRVGVTYHF